MILKIGKMIKNRENHFKMANMIFKIGKMILKIGKTSKNRENPFNMGPMIFKWGP